NIRFRFCRLLWQHALMGGLRKFRTIVVRTLRNLWKKAQIPVEWFWIHRFSHRNGVNDIIRALVAGILAWALGGRARKRAGTQQCQKHARKSYEQTDENAQV